MTCNTFSLQQFLPTSVSVAKFWLVTQWQMRLGSSAAYPLMLSIYKLLDYICVIAPIDFLLPSISPYV